MLTMGRRPLPPPSGQPNSLIPETDEIDEHWDDDLLGALVHGRGVPRLDASYEDEEIGDRITAVPDVPMAEIAAGLLARSERERGRRSESPTPAVPQPGSGAVTRRSVSPPAGRGAREVAFDSAAPLAEIDPLPTTVPPSWTEPDLEAPLSSTLSPTAPPDAAPSAAPRITGPLDLDFDAVFSPFQSASPAETRREGAAEPPPRAPPSSSRNDAHPSSLPPAREALPTLDLGLDLEDFDRTAPRRSAAAAPRLRETAPPSAPESIPQTERVTGAPLRPRTGIEIASEPPPPPPRTPHQDLHDRYAVGDFTGALVIAESILEQDPDDLDAARCAQSCRDVLAQMYSSRLGALDAPLRVAVPPDQIRWLSLDHRAGFLLSLIDGRSTIEEVLDICGMPRLDALRLLYMLLEEQVIAIDR